MIIIIFNMNSQNNAEESMNFSVIDKNESHQAHLDFSVCSLLEDNENPAPKIKQQPIDPHTARLNVFNKVKQIQQNTTKSLIRPAEITAHEYSQHFLRDLSRMQKELSFEVENHNIYDEPHNNSIEALQENKSKTLSYLKVTKQFTNKSISKEYLQDFNDYYGELIIDFRPKEATLKQIVSGKRVTKKNVKNISNQHSNSSISKELKDSISRDNDKNFYRLKELKSSSRNKVVGFKKSKSKSLKNKIGKAISSSYSHLKTSTQCQTFEQKVFTQYYGTQVNFYAPKKEGKKKGGQSGIITSKIASKEKSLKQKINVLSPRSKITQKNHIKK